MLAEGGRLLRTTAESKSAGIITPSSFHLSRPPLGATQISMPPSSSRRSISCCHPVPTRMGFTGCEGDAMYPVTRCSPRQNRPCHRRSRPYLERADILPHFFRACAGVKGHVLLGVDTEEVAPHAERLRGNDKERWCRSGQIHAMGGGAMV